MQFRNPYSVESLNGFIILTFFSFSFKIREEAIQMKLKHVIKEQTEIMTEFRHLNPVDDREEREQKTRRLRELKWEEDQVRALPDEEIFGDLETEYDWMKVSAQCFDAVVSTESCR